MASAASIDDTLRTLRAGAPHIAPSLLACDFGHVEAEVRRVEAAGATVLHLDIMDGHFVPNLSIGVPVVRAVRKLTDLVLDVHLMLDNPADYVAPFRAAGADSITVHAEVLPDARPLLDRIRALGAAAGLSLNPPTPLAALEPALDEADMILVMSVMPGFGGQEFDPVALEKLAALRDRPGRRYVLEVDGGVNDATAGPCAAAGADLLVAGTAVFGGEDYCERIATLTDHARQARSTARTSNDQASMTKEGRIA